MVFSVSKQTLLLSLVVPLAKSRRFGSSVAMINNVTPKILSIQSHTVHGYVGNKSATFPLQTIGFNVDCINTISLSNEPGYSGGFKGQTMSGANLAEVVCGLESNHLLNHDVVLTGYTRTSELLDEVEKTIKQVKENNPNALYICDPVMGDNDKFYVPQELLEKYKKQLLPLATAITPNYFEAEVLSGIRINSLESAVQACERLLDLGPKICALTGLSLQDGAVACDESKPKVLSVLVAHKSLSSLCQSSVDSPADSNQLHIYRLDFPRIDNTFSGCGDLFTALFAAGLYRCRSSIPSTPHLLGHIAEVVTEAMSAVLSLTKQLQSGITQASRELRIIESAHVYRRVADKLDALVPSNPPTLTFPPASTAPTCLVPHSFLAVSPLVSGVIFDMDGTLTVPHLINFHAMYERNGLKKTPGSDIFTLINNMPSAEQRQRAWAVLVEEEMIGCEKMEFRPHMHALLKGLQKARIRMAVSTRNCDLAFNKFLEKAELGTDVFCPSLTRESATGLNKPDPALARHIMRQWCIPAGMESTVWFVGDSVDDMLCGKRAGCKTCLISSSNSDNIMAQHGHLVDVKVDSLLEFGNLIRLSL